MDIPYILPPRKKNNFSSMEFQPSSFEFGYSSGTISRRCVLGICCMDEKCFGKPMQGLISRLRAFGDFDIIIFGEKMITTEPAEHWPQCDCLIAFFSKGFPLQKAIRYTELHPTTYCVNDLTTQELLLDRRKIFHLLTKNGIPGAKRLVISRDGYEPQQSFLEGKNFVEIDGVRLDKPFVEKPANGEDHNVYIYYHDQQGGGSVRLFRKIDNKSSDRYPEVSNVRTEGSYVYEDYIPAENAFDIKVYTVGSEYAYAEARKSPVVDGMVLRDKDGKEIRHLVELNEEEKKIAQKLVKVLGQQVCGFDLLRDSRTGHSYVCDVNGWSFVKGNQQFYDQCAKILRDIFLHAMVSKGLSIIQHREGLREFRGMVSVFRHADRTPKQKIKVKVSNKNFLNFFNGTREEVKLKSDTNKQELDRLLEIIIDILNDPEKKFEGIDEKDKERLYVVVSVLKGHFGGTKVQLKPVKHIHVGSDAIITQALFIIKWGGILTHAGLEQSKILGKTFYERVLPNMPGKEAIRNKLRVYSNNERRVKKTAEEFTIGFMGTQELQDGVVLDDKETAKMLGNISSGKKLMDQMKEKLSTIMHMEDISGLDLQGCDQIGNPLQTMREIEVLMKEFQDEQQITTSLCEGETVRMMEQRWARLSKTFYNPQTQKFDVTKIPDIFDYITYEVIHNQKAVGHDLYELFQKSLNLARFVIVEEYGLKPEDKFAVGSLISKSLLKSIQQNLIDIANNEVENQTHKDKLFFYFSSESHLQSLRNILLHSGEAKFHELKEPVMLNYLTHIVFKVYENMDVPIDEAHRFQIEVSFSSGTSDNPFGINDQHLQPVAPMISIHDRLSFRRLEEVVKKVKQTSKELHHHKHTSEHE